MCKADFEVKFFDEPLEVCIERDLKRPNSVGEKVIRQMYNQYLKPKAAVYTWQPDLLQHIIICDIDGTLAHMKDRGPYDWHKVGNDEVDPIVKNILSKYLYDDTKIFLVSGRDAVCRPETEAWLEQNGIAYDYLFMRPEGDTRKDNIVKREIFDQEIRDKYNVLFVLDDRDQVVDMWRNEIGLKVLQVAEGKF
jgi:hypothetical protein